MHQEGSPGEAQHDVPAPGVPETTPPALPQRMPVSTAPQASHAPRADLYSHGDIPYHTVSQAALQGMAVLDLDGTIQEANRALATALGATDHEALSGLNIRQALTLMAPLTWEALLQSSHHEDPAPRSHTIQARGQDGTARWLEVRLTAAARHGVPIHLLSCLDVSERYQLAGQGRQQHKLHTLGTLAGGIAHDFNNMLAAILGYTELLLDEAPHESLAWHRLKRVLGAGERAKELVRQILSVSRQQEQERRPVQLGSLIEEVLKLLRATLPVTITIHQDLSPHTGTVLAESTQLYQVVMNLCVNAEQAMRTIGGVLDIRLANRDIPTQTMLSYGTLAPGPYVCLTVRDTGIGMTPEVLSHIFEPFFTTKAAEDGTGMGLTVVQSIVQAHDGAITVTSSPGHGTTFAVYLPRFDTPTSGPGASEEPVPGGSERILFVDDEEAIARLGTMLLERLGYHVVASTSSREALDVFRTTSPSFDLVITDHIMPLMSGATLAQELRALCPGLPVILCSGFSQTINAETAQSLGINAFLSKPFLYRDLAFCVRRVLDAHQTLQP